MAKPIKVTILGDVADLTDKLGQGEKGIAGFARSVGSAASDVAKHAAGFAAAGLAAGGLGGALVESLDRGRITAALGAALGATPEEAARYGRAAGQLYAQGYGENFAEVSTAVESVVSTLGAMDNGALESLSGKAMNLGRAFGVDVAGSVSSVGILLKTGMAKDAGEAFDLITRGLQSVPASVRQELLDASDEYSVFFQDLGFSGTEAFGVLVTAAKGGKIQLDKAADALKEFRIRSVDMSATSVAAYQALGMDAEKMAKRILAGGDSAKTAFTEILNGVVSMKDPVARETAAVGLFGTQFEDLGSIDALAALNPMNVALEGVGGSADTLGKTLNENASANIDRFTRSVSNAFVDVVGGRVVPVIERVVAWLSTNLGPALSSVGTVLDSVVIPAMVEAARFVGENGTAFAVVAGLITALFVPAMVAAGIKSTISGTQQALAWTKSQLAASRSALAQVAAGGRAVGTWIAQSAAATLNAAKVVGAYALMGARATVEAAKTAGVWALSAARTVGSLALTAAGFVAQGAVMVASMAATAASVVAGWVVMGVQSLVRGAQMATAWVMAMGPVGWVIAAVVALVALIIANWDTVVAWTRQAWDWVVGAVKQGAQWIWDYFLKWSLPGLIITHWDTIVAGVRRAVNWVLDAVGWVGQLPARVAAWFRSVYDGAVDKLGELVSWLSGLPGRVTGAIGDFGSLLLSAGRDLLSGLWRGIQDAAGWLRDKVSGFFAGLLPDWARDALGIRSPSRVFAAIGRWIPPGLALGITGNTAPALAAVAALSSAMTAEMTGTELPAPRVSASAGAAADTTRSTATTPVAASAPSYGAGLTVNVTMTGNADPHRIGAEVAWAIRTSGR